MPFGPVHRHPTNHVRPVKTLPKPQELRYASAAALAKDLRCFLAGEPIAARRGGLADITARLFRETHHAVVLENWGLLWMWHSVVVLTLCVITDILAWQQVVSRWPYMVLWAGGLALWAPIFWSFLCAGSCAVCDVAGDVRYW